MKTLLVLCTICLVAVAAAPDDLLKLMDPKVLANTISDSVPSPTEPSTQSTPATPVPSGTAAERTKLLETIFKGYNKKVIPDNVKVALGISLIDFSVCENVVSSYSWMKYEWEDSRLKWNKEEYGGTSVIRLDSDDVWKPDVTLYNSADPVNMINCWHSNVLIYSTGKILWVPPCKMTSQCHLTLSVHPYGEQTCSLKFGSWTYDGFVLDLQMYKDKPEIDLSDLTNTSGFEVISTTAKRTDKYYSCCAEPYPDITFNMTIKRIPGEELFKKL